MKARRKLALRIGACAASLLASALAVEFLLRRFLPIGAVIARPDETMFYRPVPHGEYVHVSRESGWVVTRLNALGLRGPELGAKDPDRMRVAVYGDSMIQALETRLPQTFPVRLAEALAERGVEVEDVNAGVSGYGPDQCLLKFESERDAVQPDLVILAICAHNDSRDLRSNLLFRLDGDGGLRQTLHPRIDRLVEDHVERAAIAAKPALFRLYLHLTGRLWKAADAEQAFADQARLRTLEHRRFDREWQDVMRGILRRFSAACGERGIALVVMILPSSFDLIEEHAARAGGAAARPYPRRAIDEAYVRICADLDLPCLDLFDAFQAAGPASLFRASEIHLSPKGHALAAREMGRFLVDGGWVRR